MSSDWGNLIPRLPLHAIERGGAICLFLTLFALSLDLTPRRRLYKVERGSGGEVQKKSASRCSTAVPEDEQHSQQIGIVYDLIAVNVRFQPAARLPERE